MSLALSRRSLTAAYPNAGSGVSLGLGGSQAIRVFYLSTAESQMVTRLGGRSRTLYDQAVAAGHESRCRWLPPGLEAGTAGLPCPPGPDLGQAP